MQALAAQMENADRAADEVPDSAAEEVCAECAQVDCFEPPPGALHP